jgi:hypothetical protein
MQPTKPNPTGLAKDSQSLPTPIVATNPRQRNRLHNQAIKRAKIIIGNRRGHVFPISRNKDTGSRGILDGSEDVSDKTELHGSSAASSLATSPRLTVTSGGLRGDPFGAFPVSTDGTVLSAVDYFLQIYAPVHLNPRKEQLGPADSLPLARRYFGLALQNASMFELMVALASASYAARQGITGGPTRDVLIHYGKGIEALRRKMASAATCDDDATILAVMALLGIAVSCQYDSYEVY